MSVASYALLPNAAHAAYHAPAAACRSRGQPAANRQPTFGGRQRSAAHTQRLGH